MKHQKAPAATSAEVARRAGVSRTTVSFVLNNARHRGISDTTRERVLAVAREIGYVPNAAARSLAGGTSGTLALVVPKLEHLYVDAFLAQLVASVRECCHLHGFKLLIESTDGEGREPGQFLQLVHGRSIDGVIVAHPRTTEMAHLQRLRDSEIPHVVFGCHLPAQEGLAMMGDDTCQSACIAVNHLLNLGRRRVALVNYASNEYHSAAQREGGWRKALLDHGIEPQDGWCIAADITPESGYRATRELLARQLHPDALFAGNDTIAFGALRALREAALRVPQDVALVGYDDIPMAPFADPPLTSVHSDPAGHGRQAVHSLLLQLQNGRPKPPAAVQAPKLVIRESCGARAPEAGQPRGRALAGGASAHSA